jgi:hypothetical protein
VRLTISSLGALNPTMMKLLVLEFDTIPDLIFTPTPPCVTFQLRWAKTARSVPLFENPQETHHQLLPVVC